jgi:uncharacterized protein (DUF1330 family)
MGKISKFRPRGKVSRKSDLHEASLAVWLPISNPTSRVSQSDLTNDRKSTRGANIMATYVVFTRESTQDQKELNIYQSKVRKTLKGHPVKLHAAYGPQQVLEGPAPEGVVILEFPTTTAARKWYDGPAYQAIVQHRFKGATYRAVLVEGG